MTKMQDDPIFDAIDQGVVLLDADLRVIDVSNRALDLVFRPFEVAIAPGDDFRDVTRRVVASELSVVPDAITPEDYAKLLVTSIHRGMRNIRMARRGMTALRLTSRRMGDRHVFSIAEQPVGVEEELSALERSIFDQLEEAAEFLEEGFAIHDADFNYVVGNRKYAEYAFGDPDFRPERGQSAYELLLRAARTSASASRPEGMSVEDYASSYLDLAMNYAKDVRLEMNDGRVILYSVHPTKSGGYLFTILDITERERAAAEVERQRSLAHQNEKLSALGELLAGVAHELNNPLSIVVGYAQMLEAERHDPRTAARVTKIRNAAERSARIVKTFLAMARQKPATMEATEVAELVEVAADVAAYGFRAGGGELTLDIPDDIPAVHVDKDQMTQVLSNLIVNAEHATRGLGEAARISIAARRVGNHVDIDIADNGAGMDAATQKRIFEPFFTTREVGEGTGFGLAFCHRIVSAHEGELLVVSAPGKGSVFTLRLEALPRDVAGADDAVIAPGASAMRVLVIDDERDVAELMVELLEARGCIAHGVTNANAALAATREAAYDAIISDMKMPGMMGDTLMHAIIAQRPDYAGRFGFMTGDSLSDRVAAFLGSNDHPYIEKPIAGDDLDGLLARLRTRGETGQ